jgi:hypothetical protein
MHVFGGLLYIRNVLFYIISDLVVPLPQLLLVFQIGSLSGMGDGALNLPKMAI